MRIRSLADNEQSWAQYLDVDPESPESFLGYTLAGFAPWEPSDCGRTFPLWSDCLA